MSHFIREDIAHIGVNMILRMHETLLLKPNIGH